MILSRGYYKSSYKTDSDAFSNLADLNGVDPGSKFHNLVENGEWRMEGVSY